MKKRDKYKSAKLIQKYDLEKFLKILFFDIYL